MATWSMTTWSLDQLTLIIRTIWPIKAQSRTTWPRTLDQWHFDHLNRRQRYFGQWQFDRWKLGQRHLVIYQWQQWLPAFDTLHLKPRLAKHLAFANSTITSMPLVCILSQATDFGQSSRGWTFPFWTNDRHVKVQRLLFQLCRHCRDCHHCRHCHHCRRCRRCLHWLGRLKFNSPIIVRGPL